MDLETFISESLTQIVNGVKAAAAAVEGTGAVVNPENTHFYGKDSRSGGIAEPGKIKRTVAVSMVNFDIALSVSEQSSKSGGGKLAVLSVGVGGTAEKASASRSDSRIQFSVPVALPDRAFDLE